MMRIENETMLGVAIARPRNEAEVLRGALQELELVPEEAGRAWYSIPYREKQPDGSFKMVKVEGPSIKAAMALSRRWGNCTVGCRSLHEDQDGYDLEGVFIDLQTNFRVARPFRVSKWFVTRTKQTIRLDVKRQEMAIQAGASKSIRNAILAGLPVYLVSAYDKRAREIVAGKQDVPAEQKVIVAALAVFAKIQVTQEMLEGYVGKPMKDWTGADVAALRGLFNAIEDEQVTMAQAFGLETQPDTEEPKSKAEVGTVTTPAVPPAPAPAAPPSGPPTKPEAPPAVTPPADHGPGQQAFPATPIPPGPRGYPRGRR